MATSSICSTRSSPGSTRSAKRTVQIHLQNTGSILSLETKLVLLEAAGQQLLPAYLSDNSTSLLGGEDQTVTVQVPSRVVNGALQAQVRGGNQPNNTVHF